MTNALIARRPSLSDDIVAKLKQLILDESLKPGDRLPTESELAVRFGVSRISIREATRTLRHLGIIRARQKTGLTVGELDLSRFSDCLDFHAVVCNYPDEQLLKARAAIEFGVLPFVIQKMKSDPAIYERLLEYTTRPNVSTDPEVYLACDLAFHQELIAAADIQPLFIFSEVLRAFFDRFQKRVLGDNPGSMANGVKLHRRIIDGLRDGQLEKVQAMISKAFEHYESAK
jgi:DNA-binding FadR family transcriptional regulator